MKKSVEQFTVAQKKVYDFFLQKDCSTGEGLVDLISEVEEYSETVPKDISETFKQMKEIERVEIAHFVSKNVIEKNKQIESPVS